MRWTTCWAIKNIRSPWCSERQSAFCAHVEFCQHLSGEIRFWWENWTAATTTRKLKRAPLSLRSIKRILRQSQQIKSLPRSIDAFICVRLACRFFLFTVAQEYSSQLIGTFLSPEVCLLWLQFTISHFSQFLGHRFQKLEMSTVFNRSQLTFRLTGFLIVNELGFNYVYIDSISSGQMCIIFS
jgi:hypothetical protein